MGCSDQWSSYEPRTRSSYEIQRDKHKQQVKELLTVINSMSNDERKSLKEALERQVVNCDVCFKPISEGYYIFHIRLGANVHTTCPLTDVKGEDITNHTVTVKKA